MKITVVTVCYNAEKEIRTTIESVLSQTYKDIEYIIQDGKSVDATNEIIYEYLNDVRIKHISEKDSGLYNAMNKALDEATGEYVIFMNAGDIFFNNDTLANMVPYLDSDVVYGNVFRCKSNGEIEEKYKGKRHFIRLLLMGRMPCHQSMFTKTSVMKNYRFDESYTITADYDFCVRAYANKVNIKYVDMAVCKAENEEGLSSRKENIPIMRAEDDASLKAHLTGWYYLVTPLKKIYRKLTEG